jgi:hypothetical protein
LGEGGRERRESRTHLNREPDNLKLDLSPARQGDTERDDRDDEENLAGDFLEAERGGDEEDGDGGEGLREGEGRRVSVRLQGAPQVGPSLIVEEMTWKGRRRREKTHLDHLDERDGKAKVDVV